MSRTGIEDKPPWKRVPKKVRQEIETALGAPVRRAARVWGGYGPTPTYRLVLADGRRAFFKGTYHASNEFAKSALLLEERVYHDLTDILGKWMPHWYATVHYEDWFGLLLEDLGPKSVPPWSPGKTRAIAYALADFHHASLDCQPPAWLPRFNEQLERENWMRVVEESEGLQKVAALVGSEASQALIWFQQIIPTIDHLMKQATLREGPDTILHGDLRSDNLRFTHNRLYLFDWPSIMIGRPELDMVAFAQSVAVEGGPPPEQVMAWYGERLPLNSNAVACALAWWLTFFADRAWRPEIPGLPRLRRFQRQQLAMLASWAARQWSFPPPEWIKHMYTADSTQ